MKQFMHFGICFIACMTFMSNIRCCDGRGCKNNYHVSCLNPPMDDVPFGVWCCLTCVMKKIESGIHSVSEGVESIWDAREVEVSDVDGMQEITMYKLKSCFGLFAFLKFFPFIYSASKWIFCDHQYQLSCGFRF